MPFYIPHYSDSTYVKPGEPMSPQDMVARQQLFRELGMVVVAEVWRSNKGYVPRWSSGHQLTKDEMDLLCLCED